MPGSEQVGREPVGQAESVAAQRAWWDREASEYYAEHGCFLGDAGFVWGPEGWSEAELGLLQADGRLPDGPVLEIGAGAAQCSRWLRDQGVPAVASDLSAGMLAQARRIDGAPQSGRQTPSSCRKLSGTNSGFSALGGKPAPGPVPLVQCDGGRLPFGDGAFAAVFTAYGVVPFVADSAGVMVEAARVLQPGGRFVFSTTHPIRWAFPDVPGPEGLRAGSSYWDTRPYVERDARGRVTYVEHHRTLGERVREIVAAGLHLVDLVEPPWPERNQQEWGGWSPTRGRVIPGTAIFVCDKPIRGGQGTSASRG